MFSLILKLIVIILIFLCLAYSNLISYPTQSSLISDHIAILFDFNLPVIQIYRLSRSFKNISSINKPMCVNSLFNQHSSSVSSDLSTLFDYFNLTSYLIRLICWYPPLILSAELIISFPVLILSLLT